MNKEQIIELIEKDYNSGNLFRIGIVAEKISTEFEKKQEERIEFAKFAVWYYNDSLHSNSVSWEELYERFKKEKNS